MKSTATVYLSPVREPFVLSDAGQALYRKELIYCGRFTKAQPGGEVQTFDVDESLLHHWARTFVEMSAAGVEVPVPIEHTTDPEARRGTVVRLEVAANSRGEPALFGLVRFRDAEAERLAKTANVSIYVPPEFTDGKGRTYHRPIRHVALTDYPVVPGLDNFQAIAASLTGAKKMAIDWTPIVAELDLPEGVEVNDETAAGLIVLKFKELKQRIADLGGETEEEKPESKPEEAPQEAPPVAAGFVRMLKDNRTLKLDKLAAAGKLTPAARKVLEEKYLTESALTLSLSATDKADDGFDLALSVLDANPPCVPLREKTGAQALSHGNNGGGGRENVLLKDAKRRADAAGNRGRR